MAPDTSAAMLALNRGRQGRKFEAGSSADVIGASCWARGLRVLNLRRRATLPSSAHIVVPPPDVERLAEALRSSSAGESGSKVGRTRDGGSATCVPAKRQAAGVGTSSIMKDLRGLVSPPHPSSFHFGSLQQLGAAARKTLRPGTEPRQNSSERCSEGWQRSAYFWTLSTPPSALCRSASFP
ncbi:hypothetical protein BC834DRAFT_42845 [Gloeopeniophorella convolvens]|nr:hypothetical protein BC834DRAFT_42845 [Gloeopeniophorella convolvens]